MKIKIKMIKMMIIFSLIFSKKNRNIIEKKKSVFKKNNLNFTENFTTLDN